MRLICMANVQSWYHASLKAAVQDPMPMCIAICICYIFQTYLISQSWFNMNIYTMFCYDYFNMQTQVTSCLVQQQLLAWARLRFAVFADISNLRCESFFGFYMLLLYLLRKILWLNTIYIRLRILIFVAGSAVGAEACRRSFASVLATLLAISFKNN